MINYFWISFIIIGITYSIINGKIDLVNTSIITSSKNTLDLFLMMIPLMILWSGIMNIAKESGLLNKLSNCFRPLFKIIFPLLDKDDEALSYISSNIIINMLGIHNASTPFGLKAMKCLQEKNPDKLTATREMITFLVLNTSGVTLIATDIIAVRLMYHSKNPTSLIIPTIIVTIINTVFALIIDRFFYKRSLNGKNK